MRLLLDTNVVLAFVGDRLPELPESMRAALNDPEVVLHASVASLWEIAIKVGLGKLVLATSTTSLPALLESTGIQLIAINHHHVLATVEPRPATRDPFDRLLLAKCVVEGLRLVTLDRALARHPMAWRT